jgi:hypothetical protein
MKAWIWLCLCLPAAASHARQDEPPRRLSQQGEDGQAEMLRLFGEVETQLKAIDKLLSEAAAGDTRKLREAGLSNMDELLRRTADDSRKVQADIDRLLELARQAGQQGGGGGGSGGSSGGQGQEQQDGDGSSSPLSGRSEESTRREATPEGPDAGGGRPRGGAEERARQGERAGEQQGSRPAPGGQARPRDPRQAGSDPGASRPGAAPGADPRGAGSQDPAGADRWGDLPVHARDVFRTQGGRDLPPRYRDAIDGYYRRLSKNP